jgi:hypothetical protein
MAPVTLLVAEELRVNRHRRMTPLNHSTSMACDADRRRDPTPKHSRDAIDCLAAVAWHGVFGRTAARTSGPSVWPSRRKRPGRAQPATPRHRVAEREAQIEPDGVADCFWRKMMSGIGDRLHATTLSPSVSLVSDGVTTPAVQLPTLSRSLSKDLGHRLYQAHYGPCIPHVTECVRHRG